MLKTIYIVDDEPGFLQVLGLLLRRLDPSWHVFEFSLPSQALAAVRQSPPHLILSDHEMPEMNGSELLDQIREISPARSES